MRTLIRNAFVVSVDPAVGDIDGADIMIDDGIIREVRPNISGGDAEIVDANTFEPVTRLRGPSSRTVLR